WQAFGMVFRNESVHKKSLFVSSKMHTAHLHTFTSSMNSLHLQRHTAKSNRR
ncbi:hypothetical protein KI387_025525, partial [Taxus chinensis]